MNPSNEIERQVEAAFDYRGHVTITLKDGKSLTAFVYGREFANPRAPEQHTIEVILKDSDERRRIPIASIERIELTGTDYAAGNSFQDYLKKHKDDK